MEADQLLQKTVLFSRLSPASQGLIAKICLEKKYVTGDKIFDEDEEANSVVIIKEGLVRISKGADDTEITRLGPGAALGELTFLDQGRRSARATAVEPTAVYRILFSTLDNLLEKNPFVEKEFYRGAAIYVAQRLRKTTDDLQFSKEFVAKYAKYF